MDGVNEVQKSCKSVELLIECNLDRLGEAVDEREDILEKRKRRDVMVRDECEM